MTSRCMWALGVALLVSACGGSPAAPSSADAGDGITIYADPRFRGQSTDLFTDVEDLDDLVAGCTKDFHVDFDDCISSIRIPPGRTVTVYEDPRYRGASVTFTSDVADLTTCAVRAAGIGTIASLQSVCPVNETTSYSWRSQPAQSLSISDTRAIRGRPLRATQQAVAPAPAVRRPATRAEPWSRLPRGQAFGRLLFGVRRSTCRPPADQCPPPASLASSRSA